MAIHVNIGEAKTRLSELVAAAKRGEEVIIARSGSPEVRLVAIDQHQHKREIAEARRKAFGSWKGNFPPEIDWDAPVFSEGEWEEILTEDDDLFSDEKGSGQAG